VAQSDPAIPPLANLKLTALRAVKILGSARPGETIQLKAHITARLGNLIQATAQVFVMGQTILIAELTLSGANQSETQNEPLT
jgi:3-hydroxyacyl-[acyl-carrier-protein] dehydratase